MTSLSMWCKMGLKVNYYKLCILCARETEYARNCVVQQNIVVASSVDASSPAMKAVYSFCNKKHSGMPCNALYKYVCVCTCVRFV